MNEELRNSLLQITDEVQKLVDGFTVKHRLKKGNGYQIHTSTQVVHGYFDDCYARINKFNGIAYIWVSFYKEKKDGKKSKLTMGLRATEIVSVVELPF